MELSRRGFLASIAAAVTAAAVAPELIPNLPKPVRDAEAIKFSDLMEAYMNCQYGSDEPDLVWVSPRTYCVINSRIQVFHRFTQHHPSGVSGLAFNNATLAASRGLKDNEILVQNTKHPLNPHLNQMFQFG